MCELLGDCCRGCPRTGKGRDRSRASTAGAPTELESQRGPNASRAARAIDLFAGYRRYEAQYAPSGIRVNAIAPNVTRTESVGEYLDENPSIEEGIVRQTPLGRVARSEDIAQAAAWLLSDRSSYVAGVTLPTDGGMVAVRT